MDSSNYNEAVISAMLSRHSIREFSSEAVSEDTLQKILACAFAAPSAMNKQSWFVSITDNRDLIDEMSQQIINVALTYPAYAKIMEGRKGFHTFYHAPMVMMISGETDDRSLQINSGIFLQNILLATEAVGLSACPIGFARFLFEEETVADKYKKRLGIPDTHSPVIGVAIGKIAPTSERKLPYSLDWQATHQQKVTFVR